MQEANKTPETMQEWMAYINNWCERKGWNQNLAIEKMLMNLHSEITEAWEEIRNNSGVDEVYEGEKGKPEGVPIELIDLQIRLFHIFAWRGWDVQALLEQKMAHNEKRPWRHNGKAA